MPELRPGYTPLRWDPIWSPGERVRVREYTCDCQPTFYELCQAGGLRFIRRTRRKGAEILIDECAHSRHVKTMIVWAKLLSGQVG
ncbi:hypothetical protein ACTMTI_08280 [Nonomuraea sp. H19]|uniref:hypothetical protein n=1 Tax=Nonomuraea sp. H19 TaxID=3452206 RepID=UPI003F8CE353